MFAHQELIGFGAYASAAVADGVGRIPTMTSATTSGVTMSASSELSSSFAAWKAGDKDTTGGGTNAWLGTVNTNATLNVDLGTARTVFSYDCRNDSGYQNGGSNAWNFQGANASDYSDAVTLDTRSAQFTSGGNINNNYLIASPALYRYYRWVTTTRGNEYSMFIEVQLYT